MISSRNRFHGHGSLRFVYTRGTAIRSHLLVCKYVEGRRPAPRVAVVISKKVLKSAVGRNRIRRRVFEAVRQELPRIKPKTDIVFIVTSADLNDLTHLELTNLISDTLRQANLYNL